MTKILITGNATKEITGTLVSMYPTMDTVSRSSTSTYSMDLSIKENIAELAKISINYDIFINCALVPDFGQTKILQAVWTEWKANSKPGHIISFGSAVDYYLRPYKRKYPIEKRSLRDLNRSLSKHVTWFDSKIRTTYFSFGGVETEKTQQQWGHYNHFSIDDIAQHVKWIIDSPASMNIDELHITPIQPKTKKQMKQQRDPTANINWDSGDTRSYLINEE
jgi:hypothetical protein